MTYQRKEPYKWAYFFVMGDRVEYSGETDESLRRRYADTMYEKQIEFFIESAPDPGIFMKIGNDYLLRSDL